MNRIDFLFYVEDPGAANCAAELPDALDVRGWRAELFADGHASAYLLSRRTGFTPWTIERTAVQRIAERQPRAVVVGTSENPDSPGLALIRVARSYGIPSVGLVDAASNAAHRFRGRSEEPLHSAPDWLVVPDEATRRAYLDLGFPDSQIVLCGHPHYDWVVAARLGLEQRGCDAVRRSVFPGVRANQKVVVFAAELSSGLGAEQFRRNSEYTLHGDGSSDLRTDVVLQEFLQALEKIPPRPYLVLRLHPKNRPEEFAAYSQRFDAISSGGNTLEVVFAADLVVGMTTMLLLEACLLGRPALSVIPRSTEMDWQPAIGMGLLPCVWTRDTLHHALREALGGRLFPAQRPEQMLRFGARQRCVAFLESLLSPTENSTSERAIA